jgi:uncharacterized RmlC-like cupin family protein
MKEIEVVQGPDLKKGDPSLGFVRETAFEKGSALFSQSRIAEGAISAWHHHGTRDVFGYLLRGILRLEFGENGARFVELGPGDFFHIPVGLVHRDVNLSANIEALIIVILVGEGPIIVSAPGP